MTKIRVIIFFCTKLTLHIKVELSTCMWRGDMEDALNFITQNTLKNPAIRYNSPQT